MKPSEVHLDGEDARQDGTRDADGSAVVQELEERVCSEEQLSDDEISSGVHLLLQVPEILLVALGLRVSGGVSCRRRPMRARNMVLQRDQDQGQDLKLTCHTDVKVVVELGADVFDQVHGVVEALLLLLPVCTDGVCRDRPTD